MILLIGGAYQGKVDYAVEKFGISRKDIYNCTREKVEVDFDKTIINNVEELVYACLLAGRDPMKYLAARKSRWAKAIMIVNDVSCGLVPMDPDDRAFREAVGRTTTYLAQEAVAVTRVFAGIGKRLK
ncbi:MAG: bifunctional adenosylcobinamide kinase/adenosylcobinamide-phosphate guanylyltransferase [Firmicutes bacterium]|nr:bifunctional adenosylcobinamide kinase/adenosylcobinamide-phosphate guanylyltransferase [Bacillota bacterium]